MYLIVFSQTPDREMVTKIKKNEKLFLQIIIILYMNSIIKEK